MKIGICDDNPIYLNYLTNTTNDYFSSVSNITLTSIAPCELSQQIESQAFSYDLLVMDIEMGAFNGIEFAKAINQFCPSCIIIFISNHLHFATQVYDTKHVYFVFKPEVSQRLPKALQTAYDLYNEHYKTNLLIKYQGTEHVIPQSEITHIEALGRYLIIHCDMTTYQCIETMKQIEQSLCPSFVRSHKSFLVNLDHVRSISRKSCVLSTQETVPVSATFSKSFQERYISFVSNHL